MQKDTKIIILLTSIIILIILCLLIYLNKDKILNNSSNTTASEYPSEIEDEIAGYYTELSSTSLDENKKIEVNLDSSYIISKGGVYYFTGSISDGLITVDTNDNVEIILDNVSITNSNGPAICIKSSKNTYIKLIGNNTINSTCTEELDGAIYSKDSLILFGDGKINITSSIDGIVSKDELVIESGTYDINALDDGIRGKDYVYIKNGTFNIISKYDSIKSTNDENDKLGYIKILDGTFNLTTTSTSSTDSAKGIKATNNIIINGGTYNLNTTDDSIHSNGSISITNGIFEISSGDDGIHADNTLVIDDGTINITKSYEGLEASYIIINGGKITLISSDDGINIASTSDSTSNKEQFAATDGYLKILGGEIYVTAYGDGLDSNGSIYIDGGTIYVSQSGNRDAALDYNGTLEMNGGTLVAVGSSGMAQGISSGSITSVLINLSATYSGEIGLSNITYTPTISNYSSIVIASSDLSVDSTYDLLINNNKVQSITINDTHTTIGTSNNRISNGNMRGGR